ncbi:MAG: hypothetical protein J0L73_21860 [Verrucomicrobia bacterium]|nr:hypothetical protein [Verrucomicrobiota bacterium]
MNGFGSSIDNFYSAATSTVTKDVVPQPPATMGGQGLALRRRRKARHIDEA